MISTTAATVLSEWVTTMKTMFWFPDAPEMMGTAPIIRPPVPGTSIRLPVTDKAMWMAAVQRCRSTSMRWRQTTPGSNMPSLLATTVPPPQSPFRLKSMAMRYGKSEPARFPGSQFVRWWYRIVWHASGIMLSLDVICSVVYIFQVTFILLAALVSRIAHPLQRFIFRSLWQLLQTSAVGYFYAAASQQSLLSPELLRLLIICFIMQKS